MALEAEIFNMKRVLMYKLELFGFHFDGKVYVLQFIGTGQNLSPLFIYKIKAAQFSRLFWLKAVLL
ncbi:hypothetical protein JDW15_02615 [Aerococcaceae bacterium zg-ZJ1578]|uniref:hypothetical protein n=1 Tax=Aerococcaceae bacterium zg-252 TaxID=2796928 RepID=UPI001A2667A5|nr:hypothetical protein [Aerococcaceae bacterium zg-1578]